MARGTAKPHTTPGRNLLPLLALLLILPLAGCGAMESYLPDLGFGALRVPARGGQGTSALSSAHHPAARTALSQTGRPYRWGGESPAEGFDCSGLAWWAYAQHGMRIPRVSRDQWRAGAAIRDQGGLRSGDLVFFRSGNGLHVGIYTGHGLFVHSPSRGGHVRVDRMSNGYWKRRFVGGRRVS